jgi:hypothetical protein
MQEALDRLCEWARTWGMQFNEKKCKVMHVGHNNTKQSYSMNGSSTGEDGNLERHRSECKTESEAG